MTASATSASARAPFEGASDGRAELEVSVVIPCLNEADTLATCLEKCRRAFEAAALDGEIVVADNGSTDASVTIAQGLGARVVHVAARGYGHALMAGIDAARGRFVVMADADDSYDFLDVPRFVAKLREGFDLVQGCRLPAGGGQVMPGAMPFLHRWWGNPMFSLLAQWWFRAPVNDVYCGMRGFTKAFYTRLDQRCTGMEFATEMIIKSSLYGGHIAEIPITLHPDGRTSHPPHLRSFRDGWRTLRFFLAFSPRWLFLVPGLALFLAGLTAESLALLGQSVAGVEFDTRALVLGSLGMLLGYQAVAFAVFTKVFGIVEGLLPEDGRLTRMFELINLERGLVVGAVTFGLGLALLGGAVAGWVPTVVPEASLRWSVAGATLTALGFQTLLTSFLVSVLGMRRRPTA